MIHPTKAAERTWKYVRTPKGRISAIYGNQRASSKQRVMPYPTYTKEELEIWLYKNNYQELFDNWKTNNFCKELAPSVDRLDSTKPYTLDNIRLITWEENNSAAYIERKTVRSTKQSRRVTQKDVAGNFIAEYHSIAKAARDTGICRTHINSVCKGKYKLAGGYFWEYS